MQQASFVKQIKARKKILLLGNHDKKKDYKGLFDEIYDGPLLIAEKILLSHEPVYALSWCLNIHGHDHSNIEPYKIECKHLNLAANVCGYMPVSLGKLIKEGILSDYFKYLSNYYRPGNRGEKEWRSSSRQLIK